MACVVVRVQPVTDQPVIQRLVDHFAIAPRDAIEIYQGIVMDVCTAVAESGADLTVAISRTTDPAFDVESTVTAALGSGVNVPMQSINEPADLLGITQLDSNESLAILRPDTPLFQRTDIDSASMRLRRHDVVVGPSAAGGVVYLGMSSSDQISTKLLGESLTETVSAAVLDDHSVDFIGARPTVRSIEGVTGVTALLNAHHTAGRSIAPYTRAALDEFL